MKAIIAVAVLALLGASSAGAVEIKDKWGIGAGVFGRGGEISLIRGRSERSAWLFDVAVSLRDDPVRIEYVPPQPFTATTTNSNSVSILAGPGFRRFTRAGDDFSPYWDIHMRGRFDRQHRGGASSNTRTVAGAEGEFAFGLEYFTRWHFSVAAHSSLLTLSWAHLNDRQFAPGFEYHSAGHSTGVSIGLSPVIYLRGYF